MRFINRGRQLFVLGMDIYEFSLRECKKMGSYSDFVLGDVNHLPFKEKSFDTVLCMALIEHLNKQEGGKLICKMEGIARKQVIISTPIGKYKQGALHGNPYQEHKYIWEPAELKRRGYEVRGIGLRGVMGEGALFSRLAKVIGILRWIPWVLAGPLVYRLPKLAGTQICWKNTDSLGSRAT